MFSRVNVDRVSLVIVDQIKGLIREGKLRPGDRLPTERELCQRFGVSRVPVREALRVLEATGLATVRVGARGGGYLTSPTAERLGEGLSDLLSLSPLTAANVTEARMIVELGILPLVVERATADDITELYDLIEAGGTALQDGTYTMEMSAAFHIRVADSAHNPAISMLVRGFHGPLLMSLEKAMEIAPAMGRLGIDEHLKLVDAIRFRDLAAAETVLREHLHRTARRVEHTRLD
ncbi:FadR/GntR family transcriptional regulator [Asanoa iriomotensis]|uniref:GntR family transcriptional regulator n=2 Tax=Asanoa iriomotensis TaxID=234613 RepID=A0ABQ4C3Q6_9ACTN|nr:GntR family transcriptional regulator [Asanoa iriomotensis]